MVTEFFSSLSDVSQAPFKRFVLTNQEMTNLPEQVEYTKAIGGPADDDWQ